MFEENQVKKTVCAKEKKNVGAKLRSRSADVPSGENLTCNFALIGELRGGGKPLNSMLNSTANSKEGSVSSTPIFLLYPAL